MASLAPEVGSQVAFAPRYRAYILGLLALAYALNFMDRNLLGILLPQIKEELGLVDWQLGVLGGIAFAFFYATLGLPIARWADRGNRVTIIASAISVWSLMTAVCGMVGNFWQLFFARAGVGIGEAGCTPPAHSIIGDLYEPKRRASAMGFYQLGATVGGALGMFLGGWLAMSLGWRWAFILIGAPGLLAGLIIKLTMKEPPRGMSEGRSVSDTRPTILEVARLTLSRPTFRHIIFGKTLFAIQLYGSALWLPSFLHRSHHLNLGEIGTVLAIMGLVGGTLGSLGGGLISDVLARRDRRWWMWLTAVTGIAAVPFGIAGYLVSNVWLALFLLFIPAVTTSFNTAPGFAVAQRLVALNMRAMTSALLLFIVTLFGAGLGPFLIGLGSDALLTNVGEDSLRYALLAALVFKFWGSVHYYFAGLNVVQDLERAPD